MKCKTSGDGLYLLLFLRLLSFLSDNSSQNYWRDLMIDVECARLLTSTKKWVQVGLSFVVMKVQLMLLDRECTDMIFIPQRIKIGDHTQQLFLPKFKIDKWKQREKTLGKSNKRNDISYSRADAYRKVKMGDELRAEFHMMVHWNLNNTASKLYDSQKLQRNKKYSTRILLNKYMLSKS